MQPLGLHCVCFLFRGDLRLTMRVKSMDEGCSSPRSLNYTTVFMAEEITPASIQKGSMTDPCAHMVHARTT